jgi:hypothetical protein
MPPTSSPGMGQPEASTSTKNEHVQLEILEALEQIPEEEVKSRFAIPSGPDPRLPSCSELRKCRHRG